MVARDLDEDPERMSLTCLSLLRYAEAKRVFDRANKDELKAWRDNKMMEKVEEIAFKLTEEQMGIVRED